MRHRSIQALYAYWNTLRGNRLAPARTEIDPRGITKALGDVFLLDGSAADFRFRLAGSRMVASLGRALTGTRFDEIWLERAREHARIALASAADEADPILIGVRAFDVPDLSDDAPPDEHAGPPPRFQLLWPNFRKTDGPAMPERRSILVGAGEMLLLPLRHQNRVGGRILGALALFEPPSMSVVRPLPLDISGTRILARAARPSAGTGLLPGYLAETVIGRREHLVLMRGMRASDGPTT